MWTAGLFLLTGLPGQPSLGIPGLDTRRGGRSPWRFKNEDSRVQTQSFWTPERMRSARPIRADRSGNPAVERRSWRKPSELTGPPHRVAGSSPPSVTVKKPPGGPFGNSLQRRTWYRYIIRHPWRRPYRMNGKLFAQGKRFNWFVRRR